MDMQSRWSNEVSLLLATQFQPVTYFNLIFTLTTACRLYPKTCPKSSTRSHESNSPGKDWKIHFLFSLSSVFVSGFAISLSLKNTSSGIIKHKPDTDLTQAVCVRRREKRDGRKSIRLIPHPVFTECRAPWPLLLSAQLTGQANQAWEWIVCFLFRRRMSSLKGKKAANDASCWSYKALAVSYRDRGDERRLLRMACFRTSIDWSLTTCISTFCVWRFLPLCVSYLNLLKKHGF